MTILSISCGRRSKARRKREPLPLKTGDRVMRKSDEGRRVAVGTVVGVYGDTARVRWPALHRIGGEFHHSNVKLDSPDLQIATDELIAERRVGVRFNVLCRDIREALNIGQIPADWPGWRTTTPDDYFERQLERVRRSARLLVQAGR